MEPLVISHGYGLPGIQLAHELGVWNLLEQRYLTLRSGMRMIFLKRTLKKLYCALCWGGVNPSHDINRPKDYSLLFFV